MQSVMSTGVCIICRRLTDTIRSSEVEAVVGKDVIRADNFSRRPDILSNPAALFILSCLSCFIIDSISKGLRYKQLVCVLSLTENTSENTLLRAFFPVFLATKDRLYGHSMSK